MRSVLPPPLSINWTHKTVIRHAGRRTALQRKADQAAFWSSDYDAAIKLLPTDYYTGEIIRNLLTPVIGEPHHPNCWGGAFRRVLSKTTLFKPLQKTTQMTSPTSHGRRTRLYRKVR